MTEIPTVQLLATFGKTLEELRRRKICRTENIPTGDFAEHLACRAFSLTPAANSTKGYDATDAEGNRIQIKGRRITEHNSSTQLSALRELETVSFDFLIVILFDPAYRVTKAYRFTIGSCRELGRFVARTNSHTVFANRTMIEHADTVDITSRILEAYHSC
jgi:hypothetical protein